jgi:uncharacterized protein (TIGR02246 family)
VDRASVVDWVERYVAAWNSNDPDEIGNLFGDEAIYLTGPLDVPWEGRKQIIEGWLKHKDKPGNTTFAYDVIAIDGSMGVVQGQTTYLKPPATYGNLWLLTLDDDGRCARFTEYWMQGG